MTRRDFSPNLWSIKAKAELTNIRCCEVIDANLIEANVGWMRRNHVICYFPQNIIMVVCEIPT